jgi:hypothetical protein
MRSGISEFLLGLMLIAGLLILGSLRFSADRRFRVRGDLPTSAGLRKWDRRYRAAMTLAGFGAVLLVAGAAGGLVWLGRAGIALGGAGFAALVIALVGVLRERFRT